MSWLALPRSTPRSRPIAGSAGKIPSMDRATSETMRAMSATDSRRPGPDLTGGSGNGSDFDFESPGIGAFSSDISQILCCDDGSHPPVKAFPWPATSEGLNPGAPGSPAELWKSSDRQRSRSRFRSGVVSSNRALPSIPSWQGFGVGCLDIRMGTFRPRDTSTDLTS